MAGQHTGIRRQPQVHTLLTRCCRASGGGRVVQFSREANVDGVRRAYFHWLLDARQKQRQPCPATSATATATGWRCGLL